MELMTLTANEVTDDLNPESWRDASLQPTEDQYMHQKEFLSNVLSYALQSAKTTDYSVKGPFASPEDQIIAGANNWLDQRNFISYEHLTALLEQAGAHDGIEWAWDQAGAPTQQLTDGWNPFGGGLMEQAASLNPVNMAFDIGKGAWDLSQGMWAGMAKDLGVSGFEDAKFSDYAEKAWGNLDNWWEERAMGYAPNPYTHDNWFDEWISVDDWQDALWMALDLFDVVTVAGAKPLTASIKAALHKSAVKQGEYKLAYSLSERDFIKKDLTDPVARGDDLVDQAQPITFPDEAGVPVIKEGGQYGTTRPVIKMQPEVPKTQGPKHGEPVYEMAPDIDLGNNIKATHPITVTPTSSHEGLTRLELELTESVAELAGRTIGEQRSFVLVQKADGTLEPWYRSTSRNSGKTEWFPFEGIGAPNNPMWIRKPKTHLDAIEGGAGRPEGHQEISDLLAEKFDDVIPNTDTFTTEELNTLLGTLNIPEHLIAKADGLSMRRTDFVLPDEYSVRTLKAEATEAWPEGPTLYHGSPTEFDSFKKNVGQPTGNDQGASRILGDGIYTADIDQAGFYMGTDESAGFMYNIKFAPNRSPRIVESRGPLEDDIRSILRSHAEDLSNRFPDLDNTELLARIDDSNATLAGIMWGDDIQGAIPESFHKLITRNPDIDINDIYQGINDSLQNAGVDAFRDVGIHVPPQEEVFIWLKPDDLQIVSRSGPMGDTYNPMAGVDPERGVTTEKPTGEPNPKDYSTPEEYEDAMIEWDQPENRAERSQPFNDPDFVEPFESPKTLDDPIGELEELYKKPYMIEGGGRLGRMKREEVVLSQSERAKDPVHYYEMADNPMEDKFFDAFAESYPDGNYPTIWVRTDLLDDFGHGTAIREARLAQRAHMASIDEAVSPVNVHYGKGQNTVLSNFHEETFTFGGREYLTAEGAYQAHKTGKYVNGFQRLTGKQARDRAKKMNLKPARGENKAVMRSIIKEKYKQLESFKTALDETSGVITHDVRDSFWAETFPEILMDVRGTSQPVEAGTKKLVKEGPTGGVTRPAGQARTTDGRQIVEIDFDNVKNEWDKSTSWDDAPYPVEPKPVMTGSKAQTKAMAELGVDYSFLLQNIMDEKLLIKLEDLTDFEQFSKLHLKHKQDQAKFMREDGLTVKEPDRLQPKQPLFSQDGLAALVWEHERAHITLGHTHGKASAANEIEANALALRRLGIDPKFLNPDPKKVDIGFRQGKPKKIKGKNEAKKLDDQSAREVDEGSPRGKLSPPMKNRAEYERWKARQEARTEDIQNKREKE